MKKTEVYSWRVSADLKAALEREARRRETSLSALLDLAARDWLSRGQAETEDDKAQQLRLQKVASHCFGAFAGADSRRSENARGNLRKRQHKKYDR